MQKTALITFVLLGANGAFAQSGFDACLAARIAENPGKLTAEAAARKSCREQFPLSPEELEALKQRTMAKPGQIGSTTASTTVSGTPMTVTSTTGTGQTLGSTGSTTTGVAPASTAPAAAPALPAPMANPAGMPLPPQASSGGPKR